MDKKIIISSIICFFIQVLLIVIFSSFGIWQLSNGTIGLSGGAFGLMGYFLLHIFFVVLLIVSNLVKKLINRVN